jgi:hypothetical protein
MWSISFPLERLKVTLNMLGEEKVLLARCLTYSMIVLD